MPPFLYVAIHPWSNEPYLFESEDTALDECIRMNKADEEHPSFLLYEFSSNNKKYIGRLLREFGTDSYFFGNESDLNNL